MATTLPLLPHLQMVERGVAQDYKSRKGRGPTVKFPARNRANHGSVLRNRLLSFIPVSEDRQLQRAAMQLDQLVPDGIVIEFQSAQGFDLAFKSLDLPSKGIELLNVKVIDKVTYATCYVPQGQLQTLINKVREYINQLTKFGKPKNQDLVASIESIGLATIEAFWTDEVPPPVDDDMRWWEVWLRRDDLEAEVVLQRFVSAAGVLGLKVTETWIEFPDRVVTHLQATRLQLAQAAELLNLIAEVRRADLPPELPHEPTLHQQDAFVDNLVQRLQPPAADAVAITILDTGVNRAHPLLAPALSPADVQSVNPAWGVADHQGHGTQMAGMTLYGDLRRWQGTAGPIQLGHRLESIKILSPQGPETPPELFGSVTADAVALSEINAPDRKRIFCKTVTSPMHQDGVPSSYSAALDQLAFGTDGADPRLFVLAGGNVPDTLWADWPNGNLTYGIEQPGQSWNALTVGAMTHMNVMPGGQDWIGWKPISPAGELSPFSSTSKIGSVWPLKPEVVFEGGNAAVDSQGHTALTPTLQLITTHHNIHGKPLTHTCMTSPAAAQAAALTARIATAYSDYWPETLKALTVHHAKWTAQQRARFFTEDTVLGRTQLLRTCGWGVPNETTAVSSVRNRVCIVAQETLQPYKIGPKKKGAMNEMRIFVLPWPKELLTALALTTVRLRVTLCYFIEPSPSKRGWLNRYRYASHALRFDLRRNNESVQEFNKRVNAAMLDEDEKLQSPDDDGWFLGSRLRSIGCTHSDEWTGMAVKLMSRDLLAIYPVVGWWRECLDRGHCENTARFSLVLSLETEDAEVDLYTPVQTELGIPLAPEIINDLTTD